MKNEISTKLVKINWKALINNATNRKFWGESHLIYYYGDIEIYLALEEIEVTRNFLLFKVTGPLKGCKIAWHYFHIPMDQEHFNEAVFNNKLFREMWRLLDDINIHKLISHKYYDDALDNDKVIYRNNMSIALKDLDENKIKDERIRDAYLDKVTIKEITRDAFTMANQYKLVKGAYLNLCLLMGKQDEYNEYKDLDTRIVKGFKKVKEIK